ncbi:acyltransferase family protein [Eubacterium limosum]|uniref:acyltransferase family protein n=1 Tax=Eubacterium limosum TaxID=1736 RepID=UPI003723835E
MSNKIILSEVSNGRDNNLDVIRFIAALLVIFSHAFPISQGEKSADFLARFTNGSLGLGALAVSIFFVYGGFLICKSVMRLEKSSKFFYARIVRIFPPLIFMVLIVTFIFGPFISNMGVVEYFKDTETYKYLLNCLLIPVHNLPGVFDNNIYKNVVNGALWTLPIEFVCYIICFFAYKFKILTKKHYFWILIFIFTSSIVLFCILPLPQFYISILRAMILFFLGVGYYLYQDKIVLNIKIAVVSCFFIILGRFIGLFDLIFVMLFPYIMFVIGYGTKRKFSNFASHGEFSYGIYLWGWPVQQAICQFFGGKMNPYINAILAMIIALALGIITYFLVDKRIILQLKKNRS